MTHGSRAVGIDCELLRLIHDGAVLDLARVEQRASPSTRTVASASRS